MKAYLLFILFPFCLFLPGDAESLAPDATTSHRPSYPPKEEPTQLLQAILKLEKQIEDLKHSGLCAMTIHDANPARVSDFMLSINEIYESYHVLDEFIISDQYIDLQTFAIVDKLDNQMIISGAAVEIAQYHAVLRLAELSSGNRYIETLLHQTLFEIDADFRYDFNILKLSNPGRLLRLFLAMTHIESKPAGYWEDYPSLAPLVQYSGQTYRIIEEKLMQSMGLAMGGFYSYLLNNLGEYSYPLQEMVAGLASSTRLTMRDGYYITEQQVQMIIPLFEPGDILLQRREGYLSNIGIPGFWTHSALYIGNFAQLDKYFEQESHDLWNCTTSEYIQQKYANFYNDKISLASAHHPNTTIEAKGEGVIQVPIEVSASADHLLCLRPKLNKEDKLKAMLIAIENYGKPYDYDFDFLTEDLLGCSELIYKAYQPAPGKQGLKFSLDELAGRWLFSPNDFAKSFTTNYHSDKQQLEFIIFMSGEPTTGNASFKTVDDLIYIHR